MRMIDKMTLVKDKILESWVVMDWRDFKKQFKIKENKSNLEYDEDYICRHLEYMPNKFRLRFSDSVRTKDYETFWTIERIQ